MSKQTVYVAIKMSYDWYEFQEVIYAGTDYKAVKMAAQHYDYHGEQLPITNCAEEHEKLAEKDKVHIYINSF